MLSVAANARGSQAFFAVDEIPAKAPLDAEKLSVNAGMVTIVGADDLIIADGESRLAAVAAVAANRSGIGKFPGPGLVAISSAGQSADGADVDARAAFFAFQVLTLVGNDFTVRPAESDAESVDVHALVADSNAAVAEDAARAVVENEV